MRTDDFPRCSWTSGRTGRAAGLLLVGLLAASGSTRANEEAAQSLSSPCLDSVAAIYNRVAPTVVSIAAMSSNPYDTENGLDWGLGSGVVIDPPGLILTNSHVVFGSQVITVTLDDGSILPGRLVGADPLFDIALVRIAPPAGVSLRAATFGDSDRVVAGEEAFAIGNPFGLQQTLTWGIVSAVDQLISGVPLPLTEPMIQTDAPIRSGSSGGALVNRCGEVIGITTTIPPEAQEIGIAVPINLVKGILPSLMENGRIARPWFGVQGQLVSRTLKDLVRIPLVDGFLVENVEAGSPAESLGILGGNLEVVIDGQPVLLGGDIVTHIDGAPVDDIEKLGRALRSFKVGSTIHVTLFRRGQVVEADCVLMERPLLPWAAK
jgi:serine protease Do